MSASLEISTVVGCRMGCDYCPQKIHVRNYKSDKTIMHYNDLFRMLDKVPRDVEIVFAGMAEPWLNEDCTDMVTNAVRGGFKVGIYSTLYGMDEMDVAILAALNLKFFTVHLPDADGIMNLKVDDKYLSVLEKFVRLVPHNKMVIGRLHPEVARITGPVLDNSDGLFSRAGSIKTLAITPKKGKLMCSACGPKIDHNVLLPNGDCLICCMDYAQQHVIGNLMTMKYEELFQSDEYKKIMAALDDETSEIACRRCEVSREIQNHV